MSDIDNMILCLRCADEVVRTAIVLDQILPPLKSVGIDKIKFNLAIRPLMITVDSIIDWEGLLIIIMDELDFHDLKPTECLAFRIAHRLYHEAFDMWEAADEYRPN